MKSVKLQLLVTLVAVMTVAGIFAAKGLPPEDSIVSMDIEDSEGVERSVVWGVDVNTIGMGSSMALHGMASGDYVDVAALLLARGAEVDAENDAGITPLGYAVSTRMAALLIAHGADVNATSWRGDTPLLSAGSQDLVALLIAHGANVNAKDKWGNAPLHGAGDKEIAEFLIAHGAEINAKDCEGRTPLQVAVKEGRKEVADLLRQHGAKE